MSYSINLPKTTFPMKADLPKREGAWLQYWEEIELYQSLVNQQRKKCFVLHDGPPYANGDIHIGHAFDKILKDIINKSKLLENYTINYVPGWDCHGLPIELKVEKQCGKVQEVGREFFAQTCREYAATQVVKQQQSFQRLGVLGDWVNPYRTTDFNYEASTIEALGLILEAGYLVPGFKPVHWCVACGSALAEAEVEYQEKQSYTLDVKFRVLSSALVSDYPISFPIWTTTPWTLPANEAVSVHPKMRYLLVDLPEFGESFVLAKELLVSTMERYGAPQYLVREELDGEVLSGIILQHPFLTKTVPVVLGEHITSDAGTGCVHTAPAHGLEDYKIGLTYRLPMECPVDERGYFKANIPLVAGYSFAKAEEVIIELLRQKGTLLQVGKIKHSYPHCWRHKTPLIFRATRQWFIGLDLPGKNGVTLKEQALQSLGAITWYPRSGELSLRSMVENRYDWCISRQRVYGVPITLLVHTQSGEIHPEMGRLIREVIVPAVSRKGLNFWHRLEVANFLKQYASEYGTDYYKVEDTLDVWFDSGVSHYAVLKARGLPLPADLYSEGADQYRGWFQSSLLTALAIQGQAPYKAVLTHGFIVDANGHKMSKSLNNVIAPQEVIQNYGADVLRLWVASNFLHDDMAISKEILARNTDSYRLIRNTARFILGNLVDFDPTQKLALTTLLPLDRYLLESMQHLVVKLRKEYEELHFYLLCLELQRFLTNQISSFYFSVIKDRLYTLPVNHLARRSAQTALWYLLEYLVRLIAPILSFTAEEIWQEMCKFPGETREASVFLTTWEVLQPIHFIDPPLITSHVWQTVMQYRDAINRAIEELRGKGGIGSSLESEVVLYVDKSMKEVLSLFGAELHFLLIVSKVTVFSLVDAPLNALLTEQGFKVQVLASTARKCTRCWHYHDSVGKQTEHPNLCVRCYNNLFGLGEQREIV